MVVNKHHLSSTPTTPISCPYINFDSKSYGNGDGNITYVVVYSMKTDAWRRIQDSHYHPLSCPSGVYVNERLHWLSGGSEGSLVIVAFDLSDEIFWEVQLPTLFSYSKVLYHHIAVLGGCLCVMVCPPSFFNEVWMMKEYGVRESWTKFTINTELVLADLLCLLAADEILLKTQGYVREGVDQDKLVVYNPKKKTVRDTVVHGIPFSCEHGGTYVESLVSPNHGGRIGGNE